MYEVQNICGELQKLDSEELGTGRAPSCTHRQQEPNACPGAGDSGVGWSVIAKDGKNIRGKGVHGAEQQEQRKHDKGTNIGP